MSDLPRDPAADEEPFDLNLDDPDPDEPDPDVDPDPDPDEPDPDVDPDPDPDEPDPEPRPAQRAHRPGQRERLRERLERVERELAEARSRPAPVQQPAPDPGAQAREREEFRARLETMAPADAVLLALEMGERRAQQAMARQEATISERLDKQAYDAQKATSRVHQRYADRVEAVIRDERARGNVGISREAVLKYMVGEDAMRRATSAAPGQRRTAARRVAGQQVRPTGTRSDGGQSRRPPADSIEATRARIAGKPLW